MAEIVVALDHPSEVEALRLVDDLPDLRWAKVGATLYAAAGPAVIEKLLSRGIQVFLDLKWHDIPHQIEGVVQVAAGYGVSMATVHALGGPAMLEAAARASAHTELRVVAVTVLTTHSADDFATALGQPEITSVRDHVERLAGLAAAAGLDGVVAASDEATVARRMLGPDGLIVVPGIRLSGSAPDDQRRTADPASAIEAGATHLVIGRPITRAAEPRAVYQSLMEVVT